MRKVFIASVGTLLVLFLATSGYPAQGTAAVQASGDITLHFGIQHEFDFEVRDNYDLDNGLTDGCTGTDCSGPTGEAVDGVFTNEMRLIIQGSQGDIWKSRLTLESTEPPLEGRDENPRWAVERAWADIKIYDTPVHVKIGAPLWDQLDPFRLVWSDDEPGIKVYATHGNISWAFWWLKEDDSNGIQVVAENAGRDQDQDYYLARVDLDFGNFQISPFFGFVRNRTTTTDLRFARGVNGDFRRGVDPGTPSPGTAISADETLWYPGLIAKGTFGPVSFVGEFAAALGEIGDDSSVNTQREQDVSAFMVAVDVGVKLGAWTPHAGIIWMSGDDNPLDDDAEAWAPIASDNENLLGTNGILMDDANAALEVADDALTADGVSPTARQFFTQPGMIAAFIGLKGRPTKKIKTDLNLIFFQWDSEKQFEYRDGIVTTVNCPTDPATGGALLSTCPNTTFTNAIAHDPSDPTTTGLVTTIDDEVGWELNGQVVYSYNKHVTLTIAAAVFFPGDGAEVLAQCANAISTGSNGTGCDLGVDPVTGDAIIPSNERANDEAVKLAVELMVQF
ncbi:MAG: hypothetical protein IH975_09150 [Nitrospinae bacterium]|nr:hypothetical protein [Nitrospinota bacterium]